MINEIEESKPIPGFPNYEVTSFGRVFNVRTGREMALSPTEIGVLTVGLVYDHVQYRRSVKVLVARAFVPGESPKLNTPIQLDGNRNNLYANNIVWRPRWLAWEYARQFRDPPVWFFNGPIVDVIDGAIYDSIIEAALMTGTLCKDINLSIVNKTRVFPTGEQYVYM